jgi:hypothetical protein
MNIILKYQQTIKKGFLIPDIISGLLILLFAYAAVNKLMEFGKFRNVLSDAPLIGNYAAFVAAAVPVAELIIVLLLMIPGTQKTGLSAATGLLMIFTVYLVFMVLTDPHLPCSCGGVIQQLSWKQHIGFNIFFIALGIIAIYFRASASEKNKEQMFDKTDNNTYCNKQEGS